MYRKLEEAGINTDDHSSMSDLELDNVVIGIKRDYPHDGEVLMQGHLVWRKAIHRVDHENTVTQLSSVVKHRIYSVAAPNNIWHVDGNHKLIKCVLLYMLVLMGFLELSLTSSVLLTIKQLQHLELSVME